MFSDSDCTSVGFTSNWKQSRTSEDSSVQTVDNVTVDRVVQTKENDTIGVQTDDQVADCATSVSYNEDALAAFLTRICPAVVSELDRACRSNAFASYGLVDEDLDGEVKQLATLAQSTHLPLDGVKVSALSWSCTGSVVAVALSHTLHSSWCSHHSQVTLYNIDRDIKKASVVLDSPSCVRSVSMHPYLSSIVAAGTFSGEVLVWDTAREGSESALVNVARSSHDDSVTQVRWTIGTGTSVLLVSSALDGQIYFWKVSPKLMTYEIQERFAFDATSVPPGITCFDFPHHKQDTFVVALEGGDLLHCSTSAAKPIATGPGLDIAKDPTVSVFERQPSSIVSLEFSPHQEDQFATASADQAIRIYRLFQSCAQQTVWTTGSLVGVRWSPMWPYVLAACGPSGPAVTLYNYLSGDSVGTFLPENCDNKTPLSIVAFNAKSLKLIAVGNLDGIAHIWETPLNLPSKSKHI